VKSECTLEYDIFWKFVILPTLFINILRFHSIKVDLFSRLFPLPSLYTAFEILFTHYLDQKLAKDLYPAPFLGNFPHISGMNFHLRYVAYDIMHYFTHHGDFAKGSFLDNIRRAHVGHHFIDPNKSKSSAMG
jgi:hypothetical protein